MMDPGKKTKPCVGKDKEQCERNSGIAQNVEQQGHASMTRMYRYHQRKTLAAYECQGSINPPVLENGYNPGADWMLPCRTENTCPVDQLMYRRPFDENANMVVVNL
ncbi:unnamed protein product [Soboliphyme baturini]|uniref:Thyroglobulin type-1 domain-containing protein n=1 Tax=Soboliphyme baturini TaxID=241478 RepID=A0A183J0I3_9BILA|nr:unnamed protein product [Soboliphyme baturini]